MTSEKRIHGFRSEPGVLSGARWLVIGTGFLKTQHTLFQHTHTFPRWLPRAQPHNALRLTGHYTRHINKHMPACHFNGLYVLQERVACMISHWENDFKRGVDVCGEIRGDVKILDLIYKLLMEQVKDAEQEKSELSITSANKCEIFANTRSIRSSLTVGSR